MPKIVTLTFNPCIDKNITVSKLIPETKMHCSAIQQYPGGGGINVARGITRLGGDVIALYPSGGYHGHALTTMLVAEEVQVLPVDTENSTRENWMIFENEANRQYRFITPGPRLNNAVWDLCMDRLENISDVKFIVISGSMPPDFPENIFERIAAIAKKKNAKVIADTSGKALQSALRHGVYMIKPNLDELASIIVAFDLKSKTAEGAAKEIIRKGLAELVVVSMGAIGATGVTADATFEIKAPPIPKNGTVGAGDSLVAGIVFKLANNEPIKEAIEFGVACGAAATRNRGTELFQPREAEALCGIMQKEFLDSLRQD